MRLNVAGGKIHMPKTVSGERKDCLTRLKLTVVSRLMEKSRLNAKGQLEELQ
jgi:hypothetical protein